MKNKIKKHIEIFIITVLIGLIIGMFQTSFASFADFDDATAAEQTQNLLEQQEKEQEESIGKSTNNYLSNLEVKGYKISPEFEKQTQEYSISDEINENEIEITAVADDSRATIQGTGKVTLNAGENKIRVDVTAENGTVRTYFINVLKTGENNISNTSNVNQEENINTSAIAQENKNTSEDTSNKNNIIIIAVIVIVIIILLILSNKSSGKRKKH